MILVANPRAQYESHKADIDASIARVLQKGRYILGDEVGQFEEEFAAYIGVKGAVGVGSGTEAIHIALRACDVGPGDEVITVSHTAVATVAAIELCGAMPIFVDIDPATYTMNPSLLKAAVSPKTKAIVPVHLYGQPADLRPILELAKQHHVRVIEDAAQAHGARYEGKRVGSWGDMGCFSFYPTKNLGALGDGGAVVSNDPELLKNMRLLREYGWAERYVSHQAGWNSRLDELQAAILRVKLKTLDADNQTRRSIAQRYTLGLQNFTTPQVRQNVDHVYHLYVIRTPHRDALKVHLEKKEVQALIHYPVPVHVQPAYSKRFKPAKPLVETERAAREILSLPIYPEFVAKDVDTVLHAIQSFSS